MTFSWRRRKQRRRPQQSLAQSQRHNYDHVVRQTACARYSSGTSTRKQPVFCKKRDCEESPVPCRASRSTPRNPNLIHSLLNAQ
jgi:hypothetical protein